MFLKLRPKEEVSVQKLADAYDAGRTPIREAVLKLSDEGLVHVKPQAKTTIKPISETRVQQELFIRKSLEISVLGDFQYNCSPYVLDTLNEIINIMDRALQKEKTPDFYQLNDRFHRLIFSTASKELAYEMIDYSGTHSQRLFILRMTQIEMRKELIADYRKLIASMQNGKKAELLIAMDDHIEKYYSVGSLKEKYPDYFG